MSGPGQDGHAGDRDGAAAAGAGDDCPLTGDREYLQAQVERAYVDNAPLDIVGGGTRSQLGRPPRDDATTMHVGGYCGIEVHEPSELFVRVRAGTSLVALEAALAAQGQMLGAEPLLGGEDSTVGGAIATGFSGPARPWWGSLRDAVLGIEIVNGRGERLEFGGTVVKNVAGYDLSRFMVGAWGTLGVVLSVTLRVRPLPAARCTLVRDDADQDAAQAWRLALQRRALPLAGLAGRGTRSFVRLAGGAAAVAAAAASIDADPLPEAESASFWAGLRAMSDPFFSSSPELIRFSCPANAPSPDLAGDWLHNWGDAERWLACEPCDHPGVFDAARHFGANAFLYRTRNRTGRPFQALEPVLGAVHIRLKQAFDPNYVLNPGRMYAGL